MSNAELIRPQPQTSSLPMMVATAVSLGIHGLVWGIQPILPLFSAPSPNSQRTVGLVKLTPAELSRIPEYSLPQPTVPPLPPAPPPTNLLPTLPAAPPSTLLPPLPAIPYTPLPNPLPSPSNQAPRRRTAAPQRSVPPTKPAPQTRQRAIPRDNQTSSRRELLLEESRLRRAAASSPFRIPVDESPFKIPVDESPFKSPDEQAQSQAPRTQNQSTPPVEPTPSTLSTDQLQTLSKPPVQPSPPVLPTGPATSQELLPEIKVGQARQPLQTETNQTPAQERATLPTQPTNSTAAPSLSPTPNPLLASALIKSRYGYSTTGTSPGEATKRFQTWLEGLEEKTRQFAEQFNSPRKPIRQTVKSPIKEPLPDVTEAGVAVLVNPEGKIVGQPELIRSTGYPTLNQAAIENIQKLSFNPTGKYEIYQYQIQIEQQNLPTNSDTSSSKS